MTGFDQRATAAPAHSASQAVGGGGVDSLRVQLLTASYAEGVQLLSPRPSPVQPPVQRQQGGSGGGGLDGALEEELLARQDELRRVLEILDGSLTTLITAPAPEPLKAWRDEQIQILAPHVAKVSEAASSYAAVIAELESAGGAGEALDVVTERLQEVTGDLEEAERTLAELEARPEYETDAELQAQAAALETEIGALHGLQRAFKLVSMDLGAPSDLGVVVEHEDDLDGDGLRILDDAGGPTVKGL